MIINNVLSKILNRGAEENRFEYHHKCADVTLTHLSFANDILVFMDGSPSSLRNVLQVMDEFTHMSGLHINVAKSSVFIAGHDAKFLETAAQSDGINVGVLLIRYLGLPLTTKSMSQHDYEPHGPQNVFHSQDEYILSNR